MCRYWHVNTHTHTFKGRCLHTKGQINGHTYEMIRKFIANNNVRHFHKIQTIKKYYFVIHYVALTTTRRTTTSRNRSKAKTKIIQPFILYWFRLQKGVDIGWKETFRICGLLSKNKKIWYTPSIEKLKVIQKAVQCIFFIEDLWELCYLSSADMKIFSFLRKIWYLLCKVPYPFPQQSPRYQLFTAFYLHNGPVWAWLLIKDLLQGEIKKLHSTSDCSHF